MINEINKIDTENLKFIYNTILHQIERNDLKANILLVLQLAVLGYFFTQLNFINFNIWYILAIAILFLLFAILSLIFIFRTIWPILNLKNSDTSSSGIYFKHIIDNYKKDSKKTVEQLMELKKDKFASGLIEQIISTSELALLKYRSIQITFIFLSIEIISLILLFLISYLN